MANSNELEQLERIVLKLDDSIDKLTEVSANISKLLAVQEQRMNTIEKDTDRNQDDIRHLYGKLDSVSKALTDKMDESMKNSSAGHDRIEKAFELKVEEVNKRLNALEAWRWLVIGGAVVIGWFINRFFK
jgi:ABC-type transporter Mla subunit MlaD